MKLPVFLQQALVQVTANNNDSTLDTKAHTYMHTYTDDSVLYYLDDIITNGQYSRSTKNMASPLNNKLAKLTLLGTSLNL